MAGSIIGFTLLGLLALLLLLLLAPAVLLADLREGHFKVYLRVLFVRIQLWPARPKKERSARKKKTPAETPAEEQAPPQKKSRSVSQWLALIKRLADAASWGMRLLLKTVRVYDTELVWPIHAEDPALLACGYGAAQAAVGTTRAALENLLHIRFRRLVVAPDFTGECKNGLIFACKIAASPVIMLVIGIGAFLHFANLSQLFKRRAAVRKAKKRVAKGQKPQAVAVQQNKGRQGN